MCKSVFSEVEGEAFRGVEWIDLDKIYLSAGLEALGMHRKHTGYPKFPSSLCARRVPLRYYSRGHAQKCFPRSRRRSFSRGPMDRSRQDLPICGPRSLGNTSKTHRISKIPKLPMPKAVFLAVLFQRGCAKVFLQKSSVNFIEGSNG